MLPYKLNQVHEVYQPPAQPQLMPSLSSRIVTLFFNLKWSVFNLSHTWAACHANSVTDGQQSWGRNLNVTHGQSGSGLGPQ